MASNGEVWVQWFTCCLTQQGPGGRSKRQRPQQQRLRIDRSMIGAPTNFQHTGHIGGGDLADMASAHLSAIQNQMQGKGGYEASFGVKVKPEEIHDSGTTVNSEVITFFDAEKDEKKEKKWIRQFPQVDVVERDFNRSPPIGIFVPGENPQHVIP